MRKGILFVLSGPSGAGKGTILKEVLKRLDNLAFSVSATTRAPRVGEVDGVSYFFKTNEEFDQLIREDAFLERVEKFGNRYGTLKSHVESLLDSGRDVIFDIETIGAQNVKRLLPDSVLMFVTPSDPSVLEARLVGRGTEEEGNRTDRLTIGKDELKCINNYDYIIVNDDVEVAVETALSVIKAERSKTARNADFISKFLN